MVSMRSDQGGEIIEEPMASEFEERLPEPEKTFVTKGEYEKVQLWEARRDVARKIRDEKLRDINVLTDYYEGIQWHSDDDMPSLTDKATVNLMFPNIKNELANLYFKNPTPIVNETRQEYELNAFAMGELLKYYTKYNMGVELKKHIRLAILDSKFAFGCIKVSYTPRFSPNPKEGLPTIAGYNDFGEPLFVTDEAGNIVAEPKSIITSELYGAERVSPREILIDPEARNFPERAQWVAQEIVKPLHYLKQNKLYKNTDRLTSNIELSEIFQKTFNKPNEEVSASRGLYGDDTEKVRFLEIYDLVNMKLYCLPDNESFFIREENILLSPYSFLKFNEKPDDFYPIPDTRIERPLQKEVNVGRSMMITHARRSQRKYYYSPTTFSGVNEDEELARAKSPDDMSFFKVGTYNEPPKPLEMASQDATVFQNLIQSRMDFNEVSGSTEMKRGVTERRKTKGEAAFQEGHQVVRQSDKQSLVADFIIDTYQNLAKLMQNTLSTTQAIKIIGPTGTFWTEVKREDIIGEFFFDIDIQDLRPQIPELDKQELNEFIFAFSNFINSLTSNPIMMQVVNMQGTIKEFCKSYPNLDCGNILNMNVTPEQIAKMVIEQQQQGQAGGGQSNQQGELQ